MERKYSHLSSYIRLASVSLSDSWSRAKTFSSLSVSLSSSSSNNPLSAEQCSNVSTALEDITRSTPDDDQTSITETKEFALICIQSKQQHQHRGNRLTSDQSLVPLVSMTDPLNLARDKFQHLFEDETRKCSSVVLHSEKCLATDKLLCVVSTPVSPDTVEQIRDTVAVSTSIQIFLLRTRGHG